MAAMSKTSETGCRRLAHWCGARRLRCGLDSSTQRQDERSRNVMRRGLQTVPESSRKQEDKVNSARHELQWKHPQMSEHAMKSRTYRINRGVHGASWEKGSGKPHLQRPVKSAKVLEFEEDFCHLLQDQKQRRQPGDQAWTTTLVMVSVAAQNRCAQHCQQSLTNTRISQCCALHFFKRMACAKAAPKVDPESGGKIALRASADGIQLKVETTPRQHQDSAASVQLSSRRQLCSGWPCLPV